MRTSVALAATGLITFALTGGSCRRSGNAVGSSGGTVSTSPQAYQQMVASFYPGVIALQVGFHPSDSSSPAKQIAANLLEQATKIVPDEAATWADLALVTNRNNKPDEALKLIEKARSLAPNNSAVERIYGAIAAAQNKSPEAIQHFQKAIVLDANNVEARYGIVKEMQRTPGPQSDAEAAKQLDAILKAKPDNLTAQIERGIVASRAGDSAAFRDVGGKLAERSKLWAPQVQAAVRDLASTADPRQAMVKLMVLRNVLVHELPLQRSLAALSPDKPIDRFISLPTPPPIPAEPDQTTKLTEHTITAAPQKILAAQFVILTPDFPPSLEQKFAALKIPAAVERPPSLVATNGRDLFISSDDGKKVMTVGGVVGLAAAGAKLGPESIDPVDFSYDFVPDIVLASPAGLNLLRQNRNGSFTSQNAASKLPPAALNGKYYGSWPLDVESDGDMDILLGAIHGPPLVLRNNGDGTFKTIQPFTGVTNVRQFVWVDLNGDAAGDPVMLDDKGALHLFLNERGGRYRPWAGPDGIGPVVAIAAADVTRRGTMDLLALQKDGSIQRISRKIEGDGWDHVKLARWTPVPTDGSARLLTADLDNNGAVDIIATGSGGSAAWLQDAKGGFQPLASPITSRNLSVGPTNAKGRVDLLGISAGGKPVRLVNDGSRNYKWQDIRPRADFVVRTPEGGAGGDSRINTFGIGGEMELRSGTLYQKQAITGPTLHFGLGENPATHAIRIIWPNGYPRAEFPESGNKQLAANQMVLAPYRPGGSCPWMYAWNGKKMELVTDCIWRSPLGLRINAQDTAGVAQTEDWVKIRGDQLVPKDGFYDVRIAAELWETHYFDHLSLMTVDHPTDTEIYVDERFSIPMPPLKVFATTPAKPVVKAVDDNGADVTDIVRARDGRYLDTFGRGKYQGVTRDHYVEVTIGEDAPRTGPLWLIATGWIHPTDTSINIALSQGSHAPPHGLSVEIPDGNGGWVVVRPNDGFPAGKIKTVLIDLANVFRPGTARKVRLRTNLEVYWDFLGYAAGKPDSTLKTHRIAASTADLRFRGFSYARSKDASSPEMPDYDIIACSTQQWLDLEGFCTRFGDVKPLLKKVDDRYVIMNAGDELGLKFPEQGPPPSGWVRDYVLIGDGWEKDGNYNTGFCRTVEPLPYHGMPGYTTPPNGLENDPVYKKHKADWETYHTRYIAPTAFHDAMLPMR